MIDTYLFLPDNLMAILYEEQRLIQQVLDFPFKTPFPMFRTNKKFKSLVIEPPVLVDGCIIRPCIESNFQREESNTKIASSSLGMINEGFILGDAKSDGQRVLSLLKDLSTRSKFSVFQKLKCKAWYFSKVDITEDPKRQIYIWEVLEKKWEKEL